MKLIEEKRKRARAEANYIKKREIIASEYYKLTSINAAGMPLLSLPVYCSLPTVSSLLKGSKLNPDGLRKRLKEEITADAITAEVKTWSDRARMALREKLPGVKPSRNPECVDLSDRSITWFICINCTKNLPEKLPTSLSLLGACQHVCTHLTKKQKMNRPWSADQFQFDEKVRIST